jgi:hypothetical protein
VFDPDALARRDLVGRISSEDDAIGRWLFA